MDKTIKRHLSPVILNNLSCLKYKDEKYVEALAYCKEGIALCIQMGNIKILPYLYGNMSCIYEKYGREQDVEKAYNRMQLMIDIMDDNLSRPLLYDKLSEPFIIVNAW